MAYAIPGLAGFALVVGAATYGAAPVDRVLRETSEPSAADRESGVVVATVPAFVRLATATPAVLATATPVAAGSAAPSATPARVSPQPVQSQAAAAVSQSLAPAPQAPVIAQPTVAVPAVAPVAASPTPRPPTPLPAVPTQPRPPTAVPPQQTAGGCSPAYPTVCIPPGPPDLDCKDIPHKRFTVRAPDPHKFDNDGDGIGCET